MRRLCYYFFRKVLRYMNVSKKFIISIWEFMENYYGIIYDDNYKLTHNEMCYYLSEKKNINAIRLGFKDINNAMILSGEVVLIRDEEGKIVPYVNPKRIRSLDLDDINSSKKVFSKPIESYENLKDIGKKDYEMHARKKAKILSKKKRVLRRNYN